jgi:hypothetical protein
LALRNGNFSIAVNSGSSDSFLMRSLLGKSVLSQGETTGSRGGQKSYKGHKPQQEKTLTAISDQGLIKIVN